jgi:hypothetical protein
MSGYVAEGGPGSNEAVMFSKFEGVMMGEAVA